MAAASSSIWTRRVRSPCCPRGSGGRPERDGLSLRSLPPRQPLRQILPGSRDLSSFCPVAGRARCCATGPTSAAPSRSWNPARHPAALDRRGGPGGQRLLPGGERIWALLIEGSASPRLTVLALDRQGRELGRQRLEGWELEPGTGLHYDPTGDRLLLALRPLPPPGSEPVLGELPAPARLRSSPGPSSPDRCRQPPAHPARSAPCGACAGCRPDEAEAES